MKIKELVKLSWYTLGVNKKRSFLTMLGIIIGVAAVIIVMSVGAGAQSLILNQVKGLGSNLVGILPGSGGEKGPPAAVLGINITTLTQDDADAIANPANVPHVVAVSPLVQSVGPIVWRDRNLDAITFVGSSASYPDIMDIQIAEGRWFDSSEEKSMGHVVILGSKVKSDLFQDTDPIGETIRIKQESFKVIGLMKPKSSAFFQNFDDMVYVPISTAQKNLMGINHLAAIRAKIDSGDNVDQAIADITTLLRKRHHTTNPEDDDFTVSSQAKALDLLGSITGIITFFLAAMAAISLIVGGVGIMNIMLITVTERTREIGLRKAIGAKYRNILLQFLAESVILTLTGGVIGLIIGVIVSYAVALIARGQGYNWDFVISLGSVIFAIGMSSLIGIVFGMYPARRAARLNPIDALRYE